MTAILAMSLTANANLKIHSFSQGVKKGKESVKANQIVAPSDVLFIPKDGNVTIRDTKNKQIYTSLSTGSITVGSLIKNAEENASSITHETSRTIRKAFEKKRGSKLGGYNEAGVSTHNTDGLYGAAIDLPEGVSYLSYLMSMPTDEEYEDMGDVVLARRDYEKGDSSFNFSVFNTLYTPLYVNVIDQKPEDGALQFYFPENPLVKERGETLIPQYRYMLPDGEAGYIVIASPEPFTPKDVESLLDPAFAPSQDFYISLLRVTH